MTAYRYFGAFFDELTRRGVRHLVCSPGSRSAPLVLSADRRLQCWVQLDERAGGFFAVGLAKARRETVALVCTSGSAAANYLPAVTEAYYDGVALVILTADRPPELRDRGAGQTIDQIRLYGGHVRWSADLPVPDEVGADHARYVARRAVAAAAGPPSGPVHLNVPLREPLEPVEGTEASEGSRRPEHIWSVGHGPPVAGTALAEDAPAAEGTAAPEEVATLVRLIGDTERGLLAVGPSDLRAEDAAALKRLAAVSGWPVMADAASGLRSGEAEGATVVACGHHLACGGSYWGQARPEVIVRVGHPTAGRALREGLAAWGTDTWLADPLGHWSEPSTTPAGAWRSPIGALARDTLDALGDSARNPIDPPEEADHLPPAGLTADSGSRWTKTWRHAEAVAQEAISATLAEGPFLEAGLARSLGELLGGETTLYVSNSMPVRDVDAFLAPRRHAPRIVAHRGTNGIDGVVSAAAGVSAALSTPVVLLAGDLALLHDIGGLLGAARLGLDLTIVVANNDGGGIFSFLPIAESIPQPTFKRFFGTPHGTDLSTALGGLGMDHRRVTCRGELREALDASARTDGIAVIEVPVDTAANVAQHRAVEEAVRAALAEGARPPRQE